MVTLSITNFMIKFNEMPCCGINDVRELRSCLKITICITILPLFIGFIIFTSIILLIYKPIYTHQWSESTCQIDKISEEHDCMGDHIIKMTIKSNFKGKPIIGYGCASTTAEDTLSGGISSDLRFSTCRDSRYPYSRGYQPLDIPQWYCTLCENRFCEDFKQKYNSNISNPCKIKQYGQSFDITFTEPYFPTDEYIILWISTYIILFNTSYIIIVACFNEYIKTETNTMLNRVYEGSHKVKLSVAVVRIKIYLHYISIICYFMTFLKYEGQLSMGPNFSAIALFTGLHLIEILIAHCIQIVSFCSRLLVRKDLLLIPISDLVIATLVPFNNLNDINTMLYKIMDFRFTIQYIPQMVLSLLIIIYSTNVKQYFGYLSIISTLIIAIIFYLEGYHILLHDDINREPIQEEEPIVRQVVEYINYGSADNPPPYEIVAQSSVRSS